MTLNQMRAAIAQVYGVAWAERLESHRVYAVYRNVINRCGSNKVVSRREESKEPEFRQLTIFDYMADLEAKHG